MKLITQRIACYYHLFCKVEEVLLGVVFLFIVLLGLLKVLLRIFHAPSILWIDESLNVLLLQLIMLGLAVGSQYSRYIAINIATYFISEAKQLLIKRLVAFVGFLVCFSSIYFMYDFIYYEYIDATSYSFGLPIYLSLLIVPYAFLVVGLRMLYLAVRGHL